MLFWSVISHGVRSNEPPKRRVKRLKTDALIASMTVNTIPSKRLATAMSSGNAVMSERAVRENPCETTIGPIIPME